LYKRQKWATLLVIAISIANRAGSVAIFQATYWIFYVWTGVLVIASLLDFWLLSKRPNPLPQTS
jgi:hypothetical protein